MSKNTAAHHGSDKTTGRLHAVSKAAFVFVQNKNGESIGGNILRCRCRKCNYHQNNNGGKNRFAGLNNQPT